MKMKITEYRLGRSVMQLAEFYRLKQRQQKQEPCISDELIITMVIVPLAKIATLVLL